MPTYYELNDQALRSWADNFYTVANQNAIILGLDVGELNSIDAARDGYVAALDALTTARAASRGATATKNIERSELIELVAMFANQFQANPGVPQELIAELGLTVRGGGGSAQLFVPTNLVADGCSNGINMLKWSANGNTSGTQYIIEAAYDGTTDWDFVDVTTKTRFDHEGQTPGRTVVYRCYAKRASQKSGTSNEATVYAGGGGGLQVVEGGQQAA